MIELMGVGLILAFFVFLIWPPLAAWLADPARYDITKLTIGSSTKNDVIRLFGKPKSVVTPGLFCAEEWQYTIPFRLFVSLKFDDKGILKDKYRSGEI